MQLALLSILLRHLFSVAALSLSIIVSPSPAANVKHVGSASIAQKHLAPRAVRAAFDRVGLPIDPITVRPRPAHESNFIHLDKAFSVTVVVSAMQAQAIKYIRSIEPLWGQDGWPVARVWNVVVVVQPAGRHVGERASMWPMPRQVLRALALLRGR